MKNLISMVSSARFSFCVQILLLIVITGRGVAQDDPSKYFEDRGKMKDATFLKGIYDPYQNGFYMAFEHEAIPNLGLEYGVGFAENKRQKTLLSFFLVDYPNSDEKFGKVAWISARLYKHGYAERFYVGSSLMARKGADYFLFGFLFASLGFQGPLIGNFVYDLNAQFGVGGFYNTSDKGHLTAQQHSQTIMPFWFLIKLVYIL